MGIAENTRESSIKGEQIQAPIEKKAERILENHGFNTNGSIKHQEKVQPVKSPQYYVLDQGSSV